MYLGSGSMALKSVVEVGVLGKRLHGLPEPDDSLAGRDQADRLVVQQVAQLPHEGLFISEGTSEVGEAHQNLDKFVIRELQAPVGERQYLHVAQASWERTGI